MDKKTGKQRRPRVSPSETTHRRSIRLGESLAKKWDKIGPNKIRQAISEYEND